MSSRVWLITGASTGFGYEMTRLALARGDRVLATLRNPAALASLASEYPETQLVVAKLDVTRTEEIKAAFQRAKAAFGRIDIVFNNAGYAVAGEAEAFPEETARQQLEVNFWGAAHVSLEAVRFFREENKPQGGYLIQNTAVGGIMGVPCLSFYIASKHALEGFTKSLRLELSPAWNIKITAVEPGGFKTNIITKGVELPQHPAYNDPDSVASRTRKAIWAMDGWKDTARGVEKIYALTTLPEPPKYFPLGNDAVAGAKGYIHDLLKDIDTYGKWSEDLEP